MLMISGLAASAQTLQFETFDEGFVNGDIGTDITGVTPGQGDYLTFATNGAAPTTSTNAGNDNFTITDNGFEGLGFQITGPNGNKGSRFMWKDGFADLWAGRTTGNDVVEVEYDFYTGAATTSTGQVGVRLYGDDGATTRVLNGFVFAVDTKILSGVAFLQNGAVTGTYLINLATGGLVLDPETWYRIGFGYDTVTGQPFWKVADGETGSIATANWAVSDTFLPSEIDYVWGIPTPSATVPTNTEAASVTFDNLLVEAVAEEALLGVGQIAQNAAFSVFPNPASSIVNVTAPESATISQIVMTDINGRTVKTVKVDGVASAQFSIAELASGVYTLKVVSNQGSAVKKVIKQ